MSKVFTNTVGIANHADNEHYNSQTQSDVVKSVFHTVLIPLGLSIASPVAGVIYFLFAVGAYFTIFREKNHYVVAILQFAGALIAIALFWLAIIVSAGMIGAIG